MYKRQGLHTCYNGVNKVKRECELKQITKITSQFGLYSARFMGHDTSYDIKNKALIQKLEGVKGSDRSGRLDVYKRQGVNKVKRECERKQITKITSQFGL